LPFSCSSSNTNYAMAYSNLYVCQTGTAFYGLSIVKEAMEK